MASIQVGIIGCGRISDLHVPGYQAVDARIAAVCDTDEACAQRRREEWGVQKLFTDYRDVLADPEIDAVEILTPQPLHEKMVLDAARSGKHIALQKPMATDLAAADRMLAAARDAGIVFRVTDNYLHYPPIVRARQMIQDGLVGTPISIRIKMISGGAGGWEIPPQAWAWRMQEKAAGRGMQTVDHGHHLWATAWYLLGSVERVSAWIDSVDGVIDSPSVIMWKYKETARYGMCEFVHAADLTIPSNYYANDEWIEVTGSRGIIMIRRCTGKLQAGPGLRLFTSGGWRHYEDLDTDWQAGFSGATHNFINAINGQEAPLLDGPQGREILAFALAVGRSAQKRRTVYLAEMDKRFPDRYARRQKKRELRQQQAHPGLLARLGFGRKDAAYAFQALELTESLVERYDPEVAPGWEVAVDLHLLPQGDCPETTYHLAIQNGKVALTTGGGASKPTMTLTVPAGTWAAILLGKRRMETAFLQGHLKVSGKAEEGLRLKATFGM